MTMGLWYEDTDDVIKYCEGNDQEQGDMVQYSESDFILSPHEVVPLRMHRATCLDGSLGLDHVLHTLGIEEIKPYGHESSPQIEENDHFTDSVIKDRSADFPSPIVNTRAIEARTKMSLSQDTSQPRSVAKPLRVVQMATPASSPVPTSHPEASRVRSNHSPLNTIKRVIPYSQSETWQWIDLIEDFQQKGYGSKAGFEAAVEMMRARGHERTQNTVQV